MKISDVKKLLDESNGKNLIKINIPSLKKEYSFKPITIGMRKTLSKYSITSEENPIDFQIAKLGLIKSLCVEDINENYITEVDFICILASLRAANIMDNLAIKLHCNNCSNEFQHNINFDTIINNCNNYKFKTEEFSFKIENNIYKFILSEPSVIDILTLDKYIEDQIKSNINIVRALNTPYLFIKQIYKDNEIIEDYLEKSILERIQFIDDSFDDEILFGEKGLLEVVQEKFKVKEIIDIYDKVICPGCNSDLGGVVNSDSFFTI